MKKVVAIVAVCLGASIALAGVPAQQLLDQQGLKAVPGDATLDGQVDYMDLLAILDWESGLVELSDAQLRRADVSRDGLVNIDDAAVIAGQLASKGHVRIGVRLEVDPFTGVTSTQVVNPFATIAERLRGVKDFEAHFVNPSELAILSGVCTDCNGCTATKQIQAVFQWNQDANLRTANIAQCQLDQLNGVNAADACIIESQGASFNTTLLAASGYAESVTRGPAGNGDGELEDGEQMTVTSTVPLNTCDVFGYFFDVRIEVISPDDEE